MKTAESRTRSVDAITGTLKDNHLACPNVGTILSVPGVAYVSSNPNMVVTSDFS